ncbi:MAG: GPW/gp25 family protein [Hyphomicrobiales bacterium]|nr:GPW/gp25 family protein [Hyphomicrobiales bacterium]
MPGLPLAGRPRPARRCCPRANPSASESRKPTRDLDCLMNTTNLGSTIDLSDYPEVERSIVNFGLPDIVSRTIDENRVEAIVDDIKDAILAFEPRLIPGSLRVARDPNADAGVLAIRFNVSGEMSCDPVAVPVQFIADLEVGTSNLAIRKR